MHICPGRLLCLCMRDSYMHLVASHVFCLQLQGGLTIVFIERRKPERRQRFFFGCVSLVKEGRAFCPSLPRWDSNVSFLSLRAIDQLGKGKNGREEKRSWRDCT
mmetsp:Transcript_51511/g.101108  ORF Transcript_51511/g.101108 Transcript_51511/m.101108 type:complete len:104 (+) Transcript_51511:100-411(+)